MGVAVLETRGISEYSRTPRNSGVLPVVMNDVFDNYEPPVYTIQTEKAATNSSVTNGSSIIGASPRMLSLFRQVNALADLPTTVLIRGETGTGKELIARALHYNDNVTSKLGKFVAVNCAGIPQELLESLLFGHVRGAFTDAYYDKRGFVEEAHGGTLFLDEIGGMTPYLQAKILRLLQEHEITRVGDTVTKHVDVRIIAATNHNLEEKIKEGTFHSDLFYRINAFPLSIPPLRERSEDVPFLTEHFIKKFNSLYSRNGVAIEGPDEKALQKLQEHSWPGNVRELENIVARAMILRGQGKLHQEDIVFSDCELSTKTICTPLLKTLASFPGAAAREPRWYGRGVLPVLFSDLQRRQGTHSDALLKSLLGSHQIYAVNLGRKGHRPTLALMLTPDALPLFFAVQGTEFYRALENKIRSGSFNKIIQEPFMLTSFSRLKQSGILFSYEKLRDIVKQAQAYRLSEEFDTYFVLAEEHVPEIAYLYQRKSGENDCKLGQIRDEIKRHYEHFLNWQPGQPSWEVL